MAKKELAEIVKTPIVEAALPNPFEAPADVEVPQVEPHKPKHWEPPVTVVPVSSIHHVAVESDDTHWNVTVGFVNEIDARKFHGAIEPHALFVVPKE
jgi:hypothetical protein